MQRCGFFPAFFAPELLSASSFQHPIQPSFHFPDPLLRREAEILNEDVEIESCSPCEVQFAAPGRIFNDLQEQVPLFRCYSTAHIEMLSHC
jgi:hypothetical protein